MKITELGTGLPYWCHFGKPTWRPNKSESRKTDFVPNGRNLVVIFNPRGFKQAKMLIAELCCYISYRFEMDWPIPELSRIYTLTLRNNTTTLPSSN